MPKNQFNEKLAAQLTLQMLGAVRYMTALGVVHRDLKLENWLLAIKDDPSTLKLIDFGLSKNFHPEEKLKGAVGSAYYVAPEVLSGMYDAKCDMWSLGVIAYMLVTGRPPFYGKSDEEIRGRILAGKYRPPTNFAPVSVECEDFIARCLVVDPSARCSAEEALKHDWVNMVFTAPAAWDKEEILTSLRGFRDAALLQKITLKVVAFHLTPREIAGLRAIFVAIDKNHDGWISQEEFRQALETGGDKSRNENVMQELGSIFNSIDSSHNHVINYNEFIAGNLLYLCFLCAPSQFFRPLLCAPSACSWSRVHLDEQHLQQIFESLDVHHHGYLDLASLTEVIGLDFAGEDLQALIREADVNGDGKIDFNEFIRAWKTKALSSTHNPLLANGSAAANGPQNEDDGMDETE